MTTVLLSTEKLRTQVLTNNQFLERFPFLKGVQQVVPAGKCPACQKRKAEEKFQKAAERAKEQIAVMSEQDRNDFKQLLRADKLRVVYLDQSGRLQQPPPF